MPEDRGHPYGYGHSSDDGSMAINGWALEVSHTNEGK